MNRASWLAREESAPEGTRRLSVGRKHESLGSTGMTATAGGRRRNGGPRRGPSDCVRVSRARHSATAAAACAAAAPSPDAITALLSALAGSRVAITMLSM